MPRMAANLRRASWPCLALACAPSFDAELGGSTEPARADCSASLAPHDIQGPGAASGFVGQRVEVSGVVTLALAGRQPAGFFMQSAEPDAEPLTSEAVFVELTAGRAPSPGTLVRVRGEVVEAAGMTELAAIERLDECIAADGELEPVPLEARELEAAERWEGTWVAARGSWAVVDGSPARDDGAVVASPGGRLYAAGHELGHAAPPAELWSIEPVTPESAGGAAVLPPRVGATLEQIIGVLSVEGETRTLYTSHPLAWSSRAPPAPARAQTSGLRLAALNLDNYFIDLSGPGARSEEELARQRDKLVATLLALDADILALTELENAGTASLAHLLAGLDRELPPERRYAFTASSPERGALLRAAVAFRPARVRARGEAWFDERPGFRRAPVFQAFESDSARFTLGVVHFKSKRCGQGPLIVPREGCGEVERQAEADLLIEATRTFGASVPAEPLLVMGDFNSDALEAPIVALERAGFSDLLAALPAADRYSYVFDGRAGMLDHALARNGFSALTERASIWHINADEPLVRGYSLDNPPGAYAADPRRSSDHDPIIVDLRP
jgi:predicted extracellular nuclease